jgi:hypothetical protein
LEEYIQGGDLEIYGFPPGVQYYNKTFKEVAYDIAMQCNVIVIAAQVSGVIKVNPSSHIINEHSVLFAISSEDDAVDICALNGEADKGTWQEMLVSNRERAHKTNKLAGVFAKEDGNTLWLLRALSHAKNTNLDNKPTTKKSRRRSYNGTSSQNRSVINNERSSEESKTTNNRMDSFDSRVKSETSYLYKQAIEKLNCISGQEEDEFSDDNADGDDVSLSNFNLDTRSKEESIKEDEKVKFDDQKFPEFSSSILTPPRQMNSFTSNNATSPSSTSNSMLNNGRRGLGPLPSMGSLTKRSAKPTAQRRKSINFHYSNNLPLAPKLRSRSMSKEHEDNLSIVVEEGGHTILCVLGSGEDAVQAWKLVEMIVGITRKTHDTPIIVVAQPSAKLSSMSHEFLLQPNGDTLFVLEGDPKRMTTLLEAGVETCEQFITLAPTAPPASISKSTDMSLDGTMYDRENLLACAALEHHLERWNRTDLAPVYDWFHPDAIKFMSPPPASKHVLMQSTVANSFYQADNMYSKLAPLKPIKKPKHPIMQSGISRTTRHPVTHRNIKSMDARSTGSLQLTKIPALQGISEPPKKALSFDDQKTRKSQKKIIISISRSSSNTQDWNGLGCITWHLCKTKYSKTRQQTCS